MYATQAIGGMKGANIYHYGYIMEIAGITLEGSGA